MELLIISPWSMSTFSKSYSLVVSSWRLIKSEPEMMLISVLNFIVLATFFIVVCIVLYYFFDIASLPVDSVNMLWETLHGKIEITSFALSFALVFVFINYFFNSALIFIANESIEGRKSSFGEGMHLTLSLSSKLLMWSFVFVVFGWMVSLLEKTRIIGYIIARLLGSAWGLLTYFTVPVMVVERKSVLDSAKKSAEIFLKTWGETLVVNFGVGFFFGSIIFCLVTVLIVGLFTLTMFDLSAFVSAVVIISFIVLLCAMIFFIMVLSNTMDQIVNLVLYRYATNRKIPSHFDRVLIESILEKKTSEPKQV